MRRKTTIFLRLICISSLSLLAVTALAESKSNQGQSQGEIEYIVNTDPTLPVDPMDPGNEIKPNPSNPGTQNPGPLSIDYMSSIYFGKQKAYGNDQAYFAELDTVFMADNRQKPVPNYVQITDNRGTNQGWSLAVKQESQFKNEGNKTLGKAELRLFNGTPNSQNSLDKGPVANQKIILRLDNSGQGINSNVMQAKANNGHGTWTNMFGSDLETAKKSVELFVPGGTLIEKGSYRTTLIWTLSDEPG
ncbi:WxL domain-containing protein, partial [Vagococcus salmoninarum]